MTSSFSDLQKTFSELFAKEEPTGALATTFANPPQGKLADRMQVYRYAFFARIIECVMQDYPRLTDFLGEEDFAELLREMILRVPADSWSLGEYSRELPTYLKSHDLAREIPALIPLAELEWLHCERALLTAPARFDFSQLSGFPAERIEKLELILNPTIAELVTDWPIWGEISRNLRQQEKPSQLLIFLCPSGEVTQRTLTVSERELYTTLKKSTPMMLLAQTLKEKNLSEEDVSRSIAEWVQCGLITNVR